MTNDIVAATIRGLIDEQLFGILATTGSNGPHTNIVSFAGADDLKTVVFATPRQSRKFGNICQHADVSLFIDNRKNDQRKIRDIWGVAAIGSAVVLHGAERERYEHLFCRKHTGLLDFAASSELIKIEVSSYSVVSKFENLTELDVTALQ